MAQGEFGSHWKNMNPMHSADDYTAWNVMVKRTVLSSQITIFCLSSMCSLTSIPQFFLAAVLPLLWPAALPAPPLPHEQTTTCQMDFLYTMPNLHYLLFSQHLWGWAGPGYVKEMLKITISPCLEVSNVNKSVLKPSLLTSASDRRPQSSTVVCVGGTFTMRNDCGHFMSCIPSV